jgi:hypothetical protein
MARSFGKILASLTVDDDFNRLPLDAAYLYLRLLGVPSMTLAGALEYRPAKWTRFSPDWTRDTVEEAVTVLVACGYVAVDHNTEELLVRTFIRHDGIATANSNLRKGLWKAWLDLASADLRRIAVENMPGDLFLDTEVPAPQAAVDMRWSEPTEPSSEPSFGPSFRRSPEPLETRNGYLETSSQPDRRLPAEAIKTGRAGIDTARSVLDRSASGMQERDEQAAGTKQQRSTQ